MVRIVFRMLVAAAAGAGGALFIWVETPSWSPATFMIGGAGIGALLVLVLDLLGLDVPLFQQRPAQLAAGEPAREATRLASNERLIRDETRGALLIGAGVLALGGIAFDLLVAWLDAIFGGPPAFPLHLVFHAIAIASCGVVFVLGGTVWRTIAFVFAIVIACAVWFSPF